MPVDKLTPTFTFTEDRLQALQAVVPEAFADGQVNWETLKEALGAYLGDEGPGTEHFGLFWPGKRQARRLAAQPSKGTLRPVLGEGVNEDSTDNLFIEGDNLEVLKLLQKSYAGRVKLIYIDPPYNTGNDFVYKDDFREPLDSYLQKSGQADAEGLLTSNPKAGGRFHSNWLNMMLPRLMLARTLLSEDGVIFVSIDDNEVANLRQIMSEIFGEENFSAVLVWDRNRKNDAKYFSVGHEYMVVYFKNEPLLSEQEIIFRGEKEGVEEVKFEFERLRTATKSDWNSVRKGLIEFYSKIPPDDPRHPMTRFTRVDEKGPYRDDGNINWPGGNGPRYEVLHPITQKPCKLPISGWRYPRPERFWDEVKKGRIVFGADETTVPRVRTNLFENNDQVMKSVHYSYAQTSANQFNALFDGIRVFENPKPSDDLKRLIAYITSPDDFVLDFFSGSSTTAQAVLELNREDGGNRRFIMVQMPEPTPKDSAARQAGYQTIADIGKERIRRVIKKLADSPQAELIAKRDTAEDLGFAVYKLDRSHFKAWQDYDGPPDPAALDDLFNQFEDPLIAGWQPRALLDEVLLLQGFPLDSLCTRLTEFTSNVIIEVHCDWFSFRLFVCFDATIQPATIAQLQINPDDKFICLDSALTDQLRQQLADRCKLTVL